MVVGIGGVVVVVVVCGSVELVVESGVGSGVGSVGVAPQSTKSGQLQATIVGSNTVPVGQTPSYVTPLLQT